MVSKILREINFPDFRNQQFLRNFLVNLSSLDKPFKHEHSTNSKIEVNEISCSAGQCSFYVYFSPGFKIYEDYTLCLYSCTAIQIQPGN